ncbi:LOW QUALITY PROTEIN: butyrophilin subfamily 2 member A2-like [Podargus strigoides]
MATVTLDPADVPPRLVLSEDGRSVRWEYTLQGPPGPQRFDADPCVLGEVFAAGRHCWVVDVEDGQFCAVGVSKESLQRKGPMSFNPERGIWAVQQWRFQNRALTDPPTLLHLPSRSQEDPDLLDYERGEVSFHDEENQSHIFTFAAAAFGGERVRPWFWVELGSLSLLP